MKRQYVLAGVVAASAAAAVAGVAALKVMAPTALADNEDARETKLVKLKLPAMV